MNRLTARTLLVLAALTFACVLLPALRTAAQLVVGTMGGMATYGGFWIDKDGTTKIPGHISLAASGNFMETPVTTSLSGTAATILNTNPTGRRTALVIELNTASATMACTDDGTVPVLWTAPAITVTGQGSTINYGAMGLVPAGVIKCVAGGAATITVKAS